LINAWSVSYLDTHTTYPCDRSEFTCVVPCGTSTITPDFSSIPISYCLNETTTDLPTSSEDSPAKAGTWAPVRVNTQQREQAIMFSHQILFQPRALTKTLTVTVGPIVPDFVDFSTLVNRRLL
jgi:hypothetical protein